MKKCTKCGIVKPFECFYKRKNSKDGLRYECKLCDKEYYDKNKEHSKEWNKEYYDKNKEYYKEYREKNKEHYKEYQKEYYKTPQGKISYRKGRHKRRAIKLQATRIMPDSVIEKLLTRKRCFYCNRVLNGNGHLEHMFPLSKEGVHHIDNLVMACSHCNLTKNAINPYEWVEVNKDMIHNYSKVMKKLAKAHQSLSLLI